MLLGYGLFTNTDCDRNCPYCMFASTTRNCKRVSAAMLADLVDVMHRFGKVVDASVSGIGEPLLHPEIGALCEIATETPPLGFDVVTSGPQNDEELRRYWDIEKCMMKYPVPRRSLTGRFGYGVHPPATWADIFLSVDWREDSLQRFRRALGTSLSLHVRFRPGFETGQDVGLVKEILREEGFRRQSSGETSREVWLSGESRGVSLEPLGRYAPYGRAKSWLPEGYVRKPRCVFSHMKTGCYTVGISPYGLSPCACARAWHYPLSIEGMESLLTELPSLYEQALPILRLRNWLLPCEECPLGG